MNACMALVAGPQTGHRATIGVVETNLGQQLREQWPLPAPAAL
jgi:hypothetical protein